MVKEKYITKINETALNITQTQIDSVRKKNIEKTGLRIYQDGFIGYAGAIGNYDEDELTDRALKSLDNKVSYPFEPQKDLKLTQDFSREIISSERLVEECEELLKGLRTSLPDFIFFNKILLIEREVRIVNDLGLDLNYKDTTISFELLFKEKTSINIVDGFFGYQGRDYNREELLKEADKICSAFKKKVDLPAEGKIPVIFTTGDDLLYIKFWQDLGANSVGVQSSLFSGRQGQKIFNENFTLYQNNDPEDTFRPFFDLEGVVNTDFKATLIENGTFITPFSDKRSANKYGFPLTGSAQGEYDSVPNLRGYPKFKIKESDMTIKELLAGQLGILVMIASGGDYTPEGNFGTPVQLAFLFDGENLLGRLPELNVTSNIFDMFGDSFIGVSKDTVDTLSAEHFFVAMMDVSTI